MLQCWVRIFINFQRIGRRRIWISSPYFWIFISFIECMKKFLRLSDRHEYFDLYQNFLKFISDSKYSCSLHLYSDLPLVKGEFLDFTYHYKTNLLLSPSFECCMSYPDDLVWQIQVYILQNFHHICFCWLGAFFSIFLSAFETSDAV